MSIYWLLSMTTRATPLSAVRTTWEESSLRVLMASCSFLVVLQVGPFLSLKCCRTSLVFWYISVQSLPAVFSLSSSQIRLVTAMYSVRGTLEELTANLGPFSRRDCSPLLRGLLDKLMTHFFLMTSSTGVFLYLGWSCM